jgi:sporulation protein YlmC with PRC-barrel domain
MRLKEASGRKVVSTENAESIGTVEAYVIDPRKRCITALSLGKVKGRRHVRFVEGPRVRARRRHRCLIGPAAATAR